ncbi:hypothetical protein SUDANB70_00597 [Streptomyces sp. enrichment culture]
MTTAHRPRPLAPARPPARAATSRPGRPRTQGHRTQGHRTERRTVP